jgi:hypothetical protein
MELNPKMLFENPEYLHLVRITRFWEKVTIEPLENGMVHLILEGFIDPAGAVPDWFYNLVIIETPLKLILEV